VRTVKGEANELLGAWAPRHAARLSNRFQRHRPSGLSSFVLLWDHTWKGALLAFGEVCLVRRDVDRLPSKFDARWQRALYVGHDDSSNAHIVLTSSGVQLSRSIRRLPVEHQRDRAPPSAEPWPPSPAQRADASMPGTSLGSSASGSTSEGSSSNTSMASRASRASAAEGPPKRVRFVRGPEAGTGLVAALWGSSRAKGRGQRKKEDSRRGAEAARARTERAGA